jgi:hypothetical protein
MLYRGVGHITHLGLTTIEGSYPVFRSGSGRFENATLDVTWSGGLDLQTFATWSTFEGTIRY